MVCAATNRTIRSTQIFRFLKTITRRSFDVLKVGTDFIDGLYNVTVQTAPTVCVTISNDLLSQKTRIRNGFNGRQQEGKGYLPVNYNLAADFYHTFKFTTNGKEILHFRVDPSDQLLLIKPQTNRDKRKSVCDPKLFNKHFTLNLQ